MKRRTFLLSTLATAASQLQAQQLDWISDALVKDDFPKFPRRFRWGVATSSYQIEGGVHEGGRGESIWDRFCHTPGTIKTGDTADIACDHFHRWKSDVAMMKSLGIQSYRFSLAWPRFQPTGSGSANRHGVDFYSRLIDELLAQGIHPLPTLYHWDLPQALQDRGGWAARETADRFAEYAHIVTRAYADLCTKWLIFNEPSMFVNLGHLSGIHAPGIKDPAIAMRAGHIVNLAQAKAFRGMKAISPRFRIGSAFSMSQPYPATDSEQDRLAAEQFHAWENVWYLEPALHGRYPAAVGPTPEKLLDIRPGDMEQIRAPFDFIGINNYTRAVIAHDTNFPIPFVPIRWMAGETGSRTDVQWEVYPRGLYEITMRIWRDYHLPIEITENGAAYNTAPNPSGEVPDQQRIDFYNSYIHELARAIADGAHVRSYHAWSLMDNFEWNEGYIPRFGLVYVDYKTLKRTPKASAKWYAHLIAAQTS
ncbi:MAG TPA: GH1 family beta-glucosidase [Candidatus Saccharimonadales bacterium]|nr:GH1 family beta-glucosidase [Candidatus Saccharimonadales bacterium]